MSRVVRAQLADEVDQRIRPLRSLLRYLDPLSERLTAGDPSAALSVLRALWPGRMPDRSWWATGLGRVVALTLPPDAWPSIGVLDAAAVLGVGRTRAYDLVTDGQLDRHPDGGVTWASVSKLLRYRSGLSENLAQVS